MAIYNNFLIFARRLYYWLTDIHLQHIGNLAIISFEGLQEANFNC